MVLDRKIRLLILAEMILISMLAVSMPALLTTFQKEYNLTIAQSAIIPIISTLGGFITNLIIASFSARIGLKRLNLYFLALGFSAAFLLAFTSNIFLFLAGMLLIGITTAFGLTNTSTIFAHLGLKYQNYGLFHAFFGVGGIITPAIISYLLKNSINYRHLYYFLMSVFALFILFVFFSKLIENRKYETIKLKEAFSIIRKKFIFPVIILLTFQAGNEQSIVTWSGNLLTDGFGISVQTASLYLSIYWIIFTIFRLLTQLIENNMGKLNTVKLSTFLLIICLFVLLFTGNPLFFILMAAFLAPSFPLMQKYSAQKLPPREIGLFNGLIFAFSSVGNVILTGVMGGLGDYNIRYSYLIPVLSSLIILYILYHLSRLKRKGIVLKT